MTHRPHLVLDRGVAKHDGRELDLRQCPRIISMIERLQLPAGDMATVAHLASDWYRTDTPSRIQLHATRQALYEARAKLTTAFGPGWLLTAVHGARPAIYRLFTPQPVDGVAEMRQSAAKSIEYRV